jgi:hypothetical protein
MAAVLPSQALLTRFTVFRHRHPRHLLIIIGTPRRRSAPVWHALALVMWRRALNARVAIARAVEAEI